jgi:serine/threonine protein kinase/Tol biopolymer transport system component
MTPERWKQTEELYHAARNRPPGERAAFLAEACPDDEALRRNVESLLNEPASAVDFLAEPAFAKAARMVIEEPPPAAMTGRTIGGYHLQMLLGAGGMGEVYRARDSKLGRDVAIKILPRAVTSDPIRLARFEREARMLAALNHPNICAIYGLEEADGLRFLILELVDGGTLADRIGRRADLIARTSSAPRGESDTARAARGAGLPVVEALAIARQIACALEFAHEKGIIHRDLKPANVNITPDGVVKVLDFGIAKAVSAEGSDADLTPSPSVKIGGTREGAILGTAAYMSPEQARGSPVDKRTDIWAFGCVLYDMLTGRVPFAGETTSDTIGKILECEPDWSALPTATPAPIRRLLLRCLAKDPKQRLRDVGEMRIEIDAIGEVLPGASDLTVAPPAPAKSRATWLRWIALAGLAVSVGVWEVRRPATVQENPLANAQFSRFTDWEGEEEGAEISPDGKFVAFLSDRDGEFDLWLSQVGTGHFSNLTEGIGPLQPLGGIVRKLGFSGDGANIWFNPGSRRPLLFMPLTGGQSRAFLGAGANTPAWSPDGTRLVYFYKPLDGADPMYVADRVGANAVELLAPQKGMHSNNPVWSPDGQWIYFVSGSDPQDERDVDVWRVRASGGSPERLTDQHAAVNFLAPLNGRTLLYVARGENGSGPWLWALDTERKVAQRVPSGVDQYTSVASSADGRRIVATVANPSASLWRVPFLDRPADERDAQPYPLSAPTGRAMAPRFGGTSMFYLSARGASDGLSKVHEGQASEVWRSVDGALSEPPAVSADGLRLAVVVTQAGKRHLVIMSAEGTNAHTVAPSIEIEGAAGQGAASWSPDGKSIVTGGRDALGPALFKIPVDGGSTERLVTGKWVNPVWSPHGDLIVYAGRSFVGQVVLLAVRPDGVPVDLPEVWVRPGGYRFLPDGSGLVYLPSIHARDFWLLDFATKKLRPLTRLGNRGGLRTFDVTPDGKHIVFDRSRQNSDIVLIELSK